MRNLVYFVPPRSSEIVHLESAPGTLVSGLKKAGVHVPVAARAQQKDRIDLLRATLDGETVLIGEEISSAPSPTAGSDKSNLRHVHRKADYADEWRALMETTSAAGLAWASASIFRTVFPDSAFWAPTLIGHASLILGMTLPTLFYQLSSIRARKANTSDWKLSWIVALLTLLAAFLLFSPHSEYMHIHTGNGFETMLTTASDALERNGFDNLKVKNGTRISSQAKLQQLFGKDLSTEGGVSDATSEWLSAFSEETRQQFWILRLIVSLPALPIGLILFTSLQRHVKYIFQTRADEDGTAVMRTAALFNVVVAPLLALLFWSPAIPQLIDNLGLPVDEAKILQLRRAACVTIAGLQLCLLRPVGQSHFVSAKYAVEYLLSLPSSKTEKRGFSIQSNLRIIARTIYVVALEFCAIPLIHIALLFSRFWITDTLYLATLFIIWPISMLSLFVQSRR